MAPRLRVIRFALLLTALAAPHARAQRITGIVRDTGSIASLSGAVVSLLDAKRQSLARMITDASGRYSLDLTPSAAQLRVVRIGFQPRVLALPSSHAALLTLDVYMTKVPTLLSTVVVSDNRMCSSDRDRPAALSLWEQARSGLLASIVARESKPAHATIISYERWIDVSRNRVVRQTARKQDGLTTRPFVTLRTPHDLAERGYLEEIAGALTYHAPDADVLLDESFAVTHCFSVRNADDAHAGAIGIAFEPTRGRERIVDVHGTLWLEATVPALRSIEFSFVGGDAAMILGDAGGVLHFHSMSNGVVFVDEWHSRAPVMVQTRDPGRQLRIGRSIANGGDVVNSKPGNQANEAGGIVGSATWPDGEHWEAPLKPLTGVVAVRGTSAPSRGALVAIDATGDSVLTDTAGRWSIYPLFPGRYEVIVADTSYAAFISPYVTKTDVEITPTEQKEVRVELPSRAESVRGLCRGTQASGVTSILLGRIVDSAGSTPIPSGIRVSASWIASVTQMTGLFSWSKEGEGIELDDKGRFSLCGVPRENAFQLALDRARVRVTDTLITIGPKTEIAELTWRVNFGALGNLVAQQPARLQGHVTQRGTGAAIAGVDLWLPSLDRHATTDASGAFAFDSLPPGYQILQVRQLGFAGQRDTLRLSQGRPVMRDYALSPQATVLDTVSALSDGSKYLSSGLRAFEERRAKHGAGYFIAEKELRSHDGDQLANLITSKMPGLRVVNGGSGNTYLASTVKQCKGRSLGTQQCSPCYLTLYLDGVLRYSADEQESRSEPPDFNRTAVSELAGIEFYSRENAVPPPYNAARSGCGTLLLWTRER
jgi:hypothetical protein